jgi:AcrR family transcriptional regulator
VRTFGRDGFTRTTMHDIGAEAGVASGTVYQYFSDKSDVLRCLLSRLEQRLVRDTRVPVGPSGRMEAYDSVLRYLAVYRANAPVYRAWWALLQPSSEFTEAWVGLLTRHRRAWARAIQRGRADGTIAEDDAQAVTADLIEALYERCARSRIVLGWDEEVADEEVAAVMDQLLGDGLRDLPPER